MAIPQKYGPGTGGALASYNYTDIDEGIGYVIYYGFKGTLGYLTSKTVVYSNVIVTDVHADGLANYTKKIDIDFDIPFNTPKVVKGKLFVSLTQGITCYTSGKTGYVYPVVTALKWDGTTETQLATQTGDTISTNGASAWTKNSKVELIELTVAKTNFKAGETLRITIELWTKANDALADVYIGLAHDPMNRAEDTTETAQDVIESTDPTKLQIHVPFRIFK